MQCNIKDTSINYEIIGEGKPIIMIHGYYADNRVMAGCMEPVFSTRDGYKRIYIDLPGMGKSETSEWITTSDDMLDVVVDFIKKVVPNENFLIAGNSYGGYITRGVMHKMMDRVDGFALICPITIPEYKKRTLPEHVVLVRDTELLSRLNKDDAEDFNSSMVTQSERIYERYQNEIMSGVKAANSDFLQNIMKNGYGFSFDLNKESKIFDKPSLILLGRQDDCVGYKDALTMLDKYPRATFSILDIAGHNLQIEQEKVFNSLVNEWLTRVEQQKSNQINL